MIGTLLIAISALMIALLGGTLLQATHEIRSDAHQIWEGLVPTGQLCRSSGSLSVRFADRPIGQPTVDLGRVRSAGHHLQTARLHTSVCSARLGASSASTPR
jgi:hypothetical protein